MFFGKSVHSEKSIRFKGSALTQDSITSGMLKVVFFTTESLILAQDERWRRA